MLDESRNVEIDEEKVAPTNSDDIIHNSKRDCEGKNKRIWKRRTGLSALSPVIQKLLLSYKDVKEKRCETSENLDSRRSSADSDAHVSNGESKNAEIIKERQNDRIIINVGGMKHETFRSTLKIYPDTRLGWIALNSSESIDAYDPIRNEYFFDRNPSTFSQIINFYRTGKLHAPSDICGPLFEEELSYWGLEEKSMEPCCWSKYTEHRDAQDNLKVFDNPDLNPIDDDVDQMLRYEQATEAAFGARSSFTQRVLKFIKPSCFNTTRWINFKKNTWKVFEDHSTRATNLSKVVSILSITFILLSVLASAFHSIIRAYAMDEIASNNHTLETKHNLCQASSNIQIYSMLLLTLDLICVMWFFVEYLLRLISSPNRIKFLVEIMNLIDLITIIPYFIQLTRAADCYIDQEEYTEILSIARLFRLFRFFRLSTGLEILKHTLIASSKELLLLLLLLLIPIAIFATILYYCERKVSDTKFKTIPESLWWAIITMTTVGYGDMSPKTSVGKVFGALCATMSVLILALPVSIIGASPQTIQANRILQDNFYGNNFSLFYHYAQARLKLPKRSKNALVGAANALVAEPSQHSMSSDEDDHDNVSNSSDNCSNREEPNKLAIDVAGGFTDKMIYNKRFRRERLSLYVNGPSRSSSRRSRSMGVIPTGKRNCTIQKTSFNNNGKDFDETSLKSEKNNAYASDSEMREIGEKENSFAVMNGHINKNHNGTLTTTRSDGEINITNNYNRKKIISNSINSLPKTIITDCDGENLIDANQHKRNELTENLNRMCYSPPVYRNQHNDSKHHKNKSYAERRNDVNVEIQEELRDKNGRKLSNNHLYLPSLDIDDRERFT